MKQKIVNVLLAAHRKWRAFSIKGRINAVNSRIEELDGRLSDVSKRLDDVNLSLGKLNEQVGKLRIVGDVSQMAPAAIKDAFDGFDATTLYSIAAQLYKLRPLRPMPGWSFDQFLSRPDLAKLVRYALWTTLNRLPERPSMALPWHAGTTFTTRFDNDLSLVMFVDGTFEPNEFALVDSLLRPGMTIVDGGANEGVYTVFFASKVGPTGRVIAIEPSSRERERLQANIAVNNLSNVTVVSEALADQPGEASLSIAEAAHAGQNAIGGFVHAEVTPIGTEVVPTVTLDKLVTTHGMARVDLVKLDIEGAEMRALMGAENLLRTAKPLVLLELSPAALLQHGGSFAGLQELLAGAGYRLLSFDRSTGRPKPVKDGPLSENILAVHRERGWGLSSD